MTHISDDIQQQIKEKANLHNVLMDYHGFHQKSGANYVDTCPLCSEPKKLNYNEKKSVVKCFKCDIGTKDPITFLMKFHGLTYPQALLEIARIESIDTKPVSPRKRKSRQEAKHTYLDKLLDESGLTTQDVTDSIFVDEDTRVEKMIYTSGTVDKTFSIVPGDDVIIHYYDLDGKPMTYYRQNRAGIPHGKPLPFYRIRYQNPELHPDKDGRPVKYRSPYGSDTKVYLNATIRKKYQNASSIKTLYVQEGEKKADKATKHGLISVGVSGIHNIAYKNSLPKEFEMIIKRCQVENIVFVLDADWQDLSSKIDSKHPADARPKSFARAVINFQKHFYAFTATDIYLNIYFAHVKPNPEKDKGIDDLLTNSLRNKEESLTDLCDKAILDPKGDAQWLQFYNITTMSEFKILDMWHLTNIDSFINHAPYREILKDLPKFRFGKIDFRINEKGEKELAQPLMEHEKFWKEKNKSGDEPSYSFDNKKCYKFLQNRGFFRFDTGANKYIWIKIENRIVRKVEPFQIKDFVVEFAKQINNDGVENMLYRGAKMYLGPDSLSHLEYTSLNIHQPSKKTQYLYFDDVHFFITEDEIKLEKNENISGHLWLDSITDFKPTLLPNYITNVHKISTADIKENPDLSNFLGEYAIDFHEDALKCDFLHFVLNTCIFFGKDTPLESASLEDRFETNRHLLSKLTAFGYLLHRYRDPSCAKAVVGMDGQMSEVGKSNGRSGKSLFGEALEQFVPSVYIQGKKHDLLMDKYLFEEVDPSTAVIFFDDVRVNFDFEFLFPFITGKFTVEKKGIGKTTLPPEYVQKFYISTNHALNGDGGSFEDRQFLLGFSNWYNTDHKPIHDFKVRFFSEWDEEQLNRFYNFGAVCLHLYFKLGLIPAPKEKLINRKLRQEIGEAFLDWADEFFSNSSNVNCRVYKGDMYDGRAGDAEHHKHGDGFVTKYPTQRKYCNITSFKHKLRLYCQYKGFDFNPTRDGADIKTGGKEYIEIYIPEEDFENLKKQEDPGVVDSGDLFDDID